MRHNLSLSGIWEFQLDPDGTSTVEALQPDRKIIGPMPWQVAFPELQRYSGFAWYKRSFIVDPSWLEGELLLHFGAVDYWCQVFVNGQLAGQHEGGYTPFTLWIAALVRSGANEIAVRVYDTVQTEVSISRWPAFNSAESSDGPPFAANDIPHGKQEWYINASGIWQDVTLTAVPRRYISHTSLVTDIHTGEVRLKIELGSIAYEGAEERLHVLVESKGTAIIESDFLIEGSPSVYEAAVTVEAPQLWSDTSPHLYMARLRLNSAHGNDEISVRFGFREIDTQGGKLMLNGKPLFLLSVLDQDLYADTIYTVPSEEYMRDQFRKAKELGFNCLRCHIKPPDPLYLDLADEMGLLVWTEIPSWRTFHIKSTVHTIQIDLDDVVKRRVESTLEEMIRRDSNHPSIIVWTIVNEDWGTALPLSAHDRAWVREMYDLCKRLDPTRLVVDNSACPHPWGPNVHVKSDLDDFHIYANIPDQARRFTQTIEQFALRPAWTYSNHGDAERTGEEPLVLSEFGNWGLPSLRLLRSAEGKDPAWFDVGPWWSEWEGEPGWPAGADERFRKLGLDTIWRDYEEFAAATQWHQYAAMKFQIEAMRRQSSLAGYVVTELADAYWESNGLLDFYRNPKVYHDLFHSVNAPDVLVSQNERFAYWDNEEIHTKLYASHYSGEEWTGAVVEWSISDTSACGEIKVHPLLRGQVAPLDTPSIALLRVDDTVAVKVDLTLRGGSGNLLARNSLDTLVLPERYSIARFNGKVAVVSSHNRVSKAAAEVPSMPISTGVTPVDELPESEPPVSGGSVADGRVGLDLESTLEALGYSIQTEIAQDTQVAVSNYPNAELLAWVRDGGDLLYLSRGPSPFFWTQARGTAYGGGWINAFSWLRTAVHTRLKVANPLGL
ncbi:MAG: glycoside hydrolase family 2 TIM barrel-domain containing protein, partial [Chloroflexia bacterium]